MKAMTPSLRSRLPIQNPSLVHYPTSPTPNQSGERPSLLSKHQLMPHFPQVIAGRKERFSPCSGSFGPVMRILTLLIGLTDRFPLGSIDFGCQTQLDFCCKRQRFAERRMRMNRFSQIVNAAIPNFQKLYQQNLSTPEMETQKRELFQDLIAEVSILFPHIPKNSWKFNNARLLQFKRYRQQSPVFEKIWKKSNQDWALFWELMRDHILKQGWDI